MTEQLRILRPYIRGLPIILAAMAAGFLFAKKYLSYTNPMYESTTKIKLADLNEGVTGNNLFKDLDVFASTNKIATEIEVLKSQVLIGKALSGLDFDEVLSRVGRVKTQEIYQEKPFTHQLMIEDPKAFNKKWTIKVQDAGKYSVTAEGVGAIYEGTFGDTLQLGSLGTLILNKDTLLLAERPNLSLKGEYTLVRYSKERLIEMIASNLDVVSVDKDVAILRIIYKSNIPQKAALLTNTLAKTYINDYIEEKFRTAEVTSEFLDKQISKVYQDLANSELKIQGYRIENNIINIRQETETDLRKISQLKIQQTNVKMSLEAIEELNEYIQSGKNNFLDLAPNFEAFTDLLSTEMVKKIKLLQSEKTDLLLIYKPDHELIESIDKKISYYTDYFVESINNTYKNLKTKHEKLTNSIKEAEEVFIGLPERERMLTILNREFNIQQQSYIFLNEKRIEADIAKAAKYAFHRVIHRAGVPQRPVSPNRPIIIIVSTILGMMGAIVFIFLVNASKARVNDLISVEKNTDIPVIYEAPHFKSSEQAATFFKHQVFKLDMSGFLQKQTSVAFSSYKKNQGARFHLGNLVNVFLREQRKFILLTFDESYYDMLPASCALLLTRDEIASFTFAELQQWHDDLCLQHDLVLIDNFNLSNPTESPLFMGLAHQNFCVIDTRKTHLKRIEEINVIRAKNNLENLSLVLNNHNYSPSLLREAWWMLKQFRKLLKRK